MCWSQKHLARGEIFFYSLCGENYEGFICLPKGRHLFPLSHLMDFYVIQLGRAQNHLDTPFLPGAAAKG